MKIIIFSLLFLVTVQAQNVWYVDRYASGANTGRSWTDAWNYFDSSSWSGTNGINWKVIQPGDTIYVSGGTDSTLYTPDIQAHSPIYGLWVGRGDDANPTTFASGNPVIIAPAWHSGHNGRVIITTSGDNQMSLMRVMNISNVKVTGFTFTDRRVSPSVVGAFIMFGNSSYGNTDSLQYFENNHVIGNGTTGFLFLSGSKITIRSNYMESLYNDNPADCDPMGISGGRGGHTIDNNIIIMRNGNVGTDAHRDGLQFSNFGQPNWGYNERLPVTISNNLIIDTRPEGTSWNAMIYSSGPYTDAIFYVYNNIIVNRKFQTNINPIWIGKGGIEPWTAYDNSLHILNNTVITKGYAGAMVTAYNHDTLIVKNNIFIVDTSIWPKIHNLDGADGFPHCYKVFDYNYYGIQGGSPPSIFAVDSGLNINWSNWRSSYNQDINSTLVNSTAISFAEKYGLIPENYYTETGRSSGENLLDEYPFLATDILGNPRPTEGAWDIGALQFIESGSADTIPSFSFTPVTGAELNTLYETFAVFSGADSTFTVYTNTSADFKIGVLGTYTAFSKTAENGDTVYVRNTTGGSYSTLYRETIIAGGVSRNFDVTTKAAPPPPTPAAGGWLHQANGRKLFFNNGKAILSRD